MVLVTIWYFKGHFFTNPSDQQTDGPTDRPMTRLLEPLWAGKKGRQQPHQTMEGTKETAAPNKKQKLQRWQETSSQPWANSTPKMPGKCLQKNSTLCLRAPSQSRSNRQSIFIITWKVAQPRHPGNAKKHNQKSQRGAEQEQYPCAKTIYFFKLVTPLSSEQVIHHVQNLDCANHLFSRQRKKPNTQRHCKYKKKEEQGHWKGTRNLQTHWRDSLKNNPAQENKLQTDSAPPPRPKTNTPLKWYTNVTIQTRPTNHEPLIKFQLWSQLWEHRGFDNFF